MSQWALFHTLNLISSQALTGWVHYSWEITEFQNRVEPEKSCQISADSSPFYK